MSARIIVNVSEGKIVLIGGSPEAGMPDVGLSDGLTRASGEELSAALGAIGDIVKSFQATIDALPSRPQTIEVEFGASFGRECDLWIVSGDANPEFRIRLVWGAQG